MLAKCSIRSAFCVMMCHKPPPHSSADEVAGYFTFLIAMRSVPDGT